MESWNLSYHLKSRPVWGFIDNDKLNIADEYLCVDDICVALINKDNE